ncbi:sensor domain-containing protein [Nitrosophilus labii]|uniref:sensor domain-containing protein n=1 Tax=Nitrosophilus labii TaxID=2706014 RepID=UPI001656D4AA|nr:GGDEF domain-containing phosphodiesterase [Nitrosophilus labii]
MRMINFNSLIIKILIVIFLIISIFFLYNLFNLKLAKESLENMENSRVESIIENEISILKDSIYFDFEEPIKDSLNRIFLHLNNLKGIYLKNYITKKEYKLFRDSKNPFISKNSNLIYKKFKIYNDKEEIAEIEVAYENLYSKEFFIKYKNALFFTLIIFLTILLFLFIYLYRKIKAIYILANDLKNIDPNNPKILKTMDRYFEIVLIVNSINSFLLKLKDSSEISKRLYRKLIEKQNHLEDAQRLAHIGSWEYIPEKNRFFVSKEFFRLIGFKKDEKINWQIFLKKIPSDDRKIFEDKIKIALQNGSKFDFIHKIMNKYGKIKYLKTEAKVKKHKNNPTKILGISMDITEEMEAKKKVEFLAYHDTLTLLLNRTAFLERMDFFIKLSKRKNLKFAILYIDLDNFKYINDTFGHTVGDELLVIVSKILKNILRESDVIARVGGDEFIILLPFINNKDDIEKISKKIINSISKEYNIKNYVFNVTCSIGISTFPDDSLDAEELIKYADTVMYESKKNGKNRYNFFDVSIKKSMENYHEITKDLKEALKKDNEIRLYFQPKISLTYREIVSAEVLSRWMHPIKGLMYPNEYIHIAENSNLIIEYDNYIIEKSFAQIKEWENSEFSLLSLSVNISARQFKSKEFLSKIEELLKVYKIDPKKIEFEITETLAMDNIENSIEILEKIKKLGFKISIDDFGSGYSSLNYLKRLPYDTIKIDREFIKDLHIDNDDIIITKLIVQLAKTLNKKAVAEGVEIDEHIKILKSIGCDFVQGYYFAKPMDKEDFLDYVKNF